MVFVKKVPPILSLPKEGIGLQATLRSQTWDYPCRTIPLSYACLDRATETSLVPCITLGRALSNQETNLVAS